MGGMSCYNTLMIQKAKAKPLYSIWSNMVARCNAPSNGGYKDYGARGIKVCKRWENSYQAFESDMPPRPSSDHELDRIDNDEDYKPSNCQWVLHSDNCAYNKRRVRKDNKVGASGVYFHKGKNRYHATITVHTRRIHLGWFASKDMAIKVRKKAEEMFIGFIE